MTLIFVAKTIVGILASASVLFCIWTAIAYHGGRKS